MKQAAQIETEYFMGQGMVFIGRKNATTGEPEGLRHLGNVPDLSISNKTDSLKLKESMTGTRGSAMRKTTGIEVNFSCKLESLNKENLGIALRGTVSTTAGSTVVKKTFKAFKDSVLKLDHIGISAVTVFDAATGLVAYTVATDYIVNDNSISIPATGAIAALDIAGAGIDVKVSYTYASFDKIEAFTEAETNYYLFFDGLNTANENKAVVIDIYKVAMDVLKQLDMINDKQAEIVLEGEALMDSTRTTGSKYYTVRKA